MANASVVIADRIACKLLQGIRSFAARMNANARLETIEVDSGAVIVESRLETHELHRNAAVRAYDADFCHESTFVFDSSNTYGRLEVFMLQAIAIALSC